VISIIDDDRYVQRGFQILLKSAGLECRVFSGVEEFLETWEHNQNDILILDIHMPGLNGSDLLNHLESIQVHLPVIVITAYDETESQELAKKYGVLAYLTKPVDGEVLLDLLKNNKSIELPISDYWTN
jgi:FixJ family two-component response regulator